MTDQNRQQLWHLILQYEDLDPAQRLSVDQALAADPDLRRDWDQLRTLEQKAQLAWSTDDEDFWQPAMDQTTADRCRVSLEAILAELPQTTAPGDSTDGPLPFVDSADRPPVAGRVSGMRRVLSTRVLWPLAAVLALVVLYPRVATNRSLITDLGVRTIDVAAGGTRSGQGTALIEGQLATGQAFVLELAPTEATWLVVYHVDPAGHPTRLYAAPVADHSGRTGSLTIPPADTGDFWVLDGEPGFESFVVGATAKAIPDLTDLSAAVADGCSEAQGRAAAVDAVAEALADGLPEVQILTFEHVD